MCILKTLHSTGIMWVNDCLTIKIAINYLKWLHSTTYMMIIFRITCEIIGFLRFYDEMYCFYVLFSDTPYSISAKKWICVQYIHDDVEITYSITIKMRSVVTLIWKDRKRPKIWSNYSIIATDLKFYPYTICAWMFMDIDPIF